MWDSSGYSSAISIEQGLNEVDTEYVEQKNQEILASEAAKIHKAMDYPSLSKDSFHKNKAIACLARSKGTTTTI